MSSTTPVLLPRRAATVVAQSMQDFRVVVVHGARQVGKTTLVQIVARDLSAAYLTLDRAGDREALAADPADFLDSAGTPLVIDEVQRVGEPLVIAVKVVVDNDNRPGRYLLTGSTNFLTVPGIAESLAGRVDLVTLWPLSMGERSGGRDDFVDRCFGQENLLHHLGEVPTRTQYLEMLTIGGYPAVQAMADRARRRWSSRYVDTVLSREIEVAADIRRIDAMRDMVRYFAATTAQELVVSSVANRLGIDRSTVETYEAWLETVFLIHRVPAWSRNLAAKVVRRPKIYMADTGVAAALLAKTPQTLMSPTDPATGALVETFVANELAKQLTWSETPARLGHFRRSDGAEVDLVLESDDGRVVGVEVKASSTPRAEDFRWLAMLRDGLDASGGDFVQGVLLYAGDRRLPFGDRLVALPIADLWT